jgi:hypothetical protein
MPARGTARGIWAQNPSSFNLFSLPWVWMVDAQQPGTLVGGSVADWPDLIGGNDPVQANPVLRPVWLATGFNGRPTVRSDGINDILQTMPFAIPQPFELWFVGKWNGVGPPASIQRLFDGVLAAFRIQRNIADLYNSFAGAAAAVAFPASSDSRYSIGTLFNGAASEFVLAGSITNVNLGANDPGGIALFSSIAGTVPAPADLSWAAIANRALTINERTLLRAALNQQWGPLV